MSDSPSKSAVIQKNVPPTTRGTRPRDAELAQDPPHWRDPWILLDLEGDAARRLVEVLQRGETRVGVDEHGPELVDGQGLAVLTDAHLSVEDGPGRRESDRGCCGGQHRTRYCETRGGERHIDGAPHGRAHRAGREAANAGEKPGGMCPRARKGTADGRRQRDAGIGHDLLPP